MADLKRRFSPCLEWIFADPVAIEDRMAAAAASGLSQVEFWSWRERGVDRLADALHNAGVGISALVVEPPEDIGDPTRHRDWLNSVEQSAKVAVRLGSPVLVAIAGRPSSGIPEHQQLRAMTEALAAAAAIAGDHGVKIALEPLSNQDGQALELLTSSSTALEVVGEVDSPSLGILFDVYHSHVMGEDVPKTIRLLGSHIIHVQVADNPGRNEPGTGRISWEPVLSALDEIGYDGVIGLEYKPTMSSAESVGFTARVLALATAT
jgi:hydroxypyruvate isomerase